MFRKACLVLIVAFTTFSASAQNNSLNPQFSIIGFSLKESGRFIIDTNSVFGSVQLKGDFLKFAEPTEVAADVSQDVIYNVSGVNAKVIASVRFYNDGTSRAVAVILTTDLSNQGYMFLFLTKESGYEQLNYTPILGTASAIGAHADQAVSQLDEIRKDLPNNVRRIAKYFQAHPTEQMSDLLLKIELKDAEILAVPKPGAAEDLTVLTTIPSNPVLTPNPVIDPVPDDFIDPTVDPSGQGDPIINPLVDPMEPGTTYEVPEDDTNFIDNLLGLDSDGRVIRSDSDKYEVPLQIGRQRRPIPGGELLTEEDLEFEEEVTSGGSVVFDNSQFFENDDEGEFYFNDEAPGSFGF